MKIRQPEDVDSILPLIKAKKLLGRLTFNEIRKRSSFTQPENKIDGS